MKEKRLGAGLWCICTSRCSVFGSPLRASRGITSRSGFYENRMDFYWRHVGAVDTKELFMSDVIDLQKAREEREPHISGYLFCMGCNHEWTAVWKPGTTEFECPECKSMRGRNKYNVSPSPGSHVWSCIACDNQLFSLMQDRVHCPGCGKQWGYEELTS